MKRKAKDKQIVYIVDDDPAVRDSLRLLMKSVGRDTEVFESPDHFLENHGAELTGCLILDIRMPGMSGLELQQRLHDQGENIPIIFITGHGDVSMAVEAMKRGAFEFLQKPFREQHLIDRINDALKQDAETRKNAEQRAEVVQRAATLTPRESQILDMITEGKASKVIAIELGVSERTIDTHRARIMQKMKARSLAEIIQAGVYLRDRS